VQLHYLTLLYGENGPGQTVLAKSKPDCNGKCTVREWDWRFIVQIGKLVYACNYMILHPKTGHASEWHC
jgi:hypothetical protein